MQFVFSLANPSIALLAFFLAFLTWRFTPTYYFNEICGKVKADKNFLLFIGNYKFKHVYTF
ncbi:hypothetical protein AN964_15550 [Heyndrickxia shackletonii]|uniref:Uncharacterized protein n=1 Tax=Heyndrickxia shackletonii TaxID=157838 RepID=A0A0Q3TLD3_9BACI|nr:hypothetical protein AN964_15550 [Heyndrickxia shackletonii]